MTTAPIGTRRRWAWRAATGTALLALAVALLAGPYGFLLGNVAGSAVQPAREAPCLPGEPVDIIDSPHISQAAADAVEYSSLPPTSGPHFPFTIATGVYDQPVAEGLFVHAMEHGHVVIHYPPDAPRPEVDALTRVAKRYGDDVILAPYPPLDAGIALTAWGRIDHLDRYDEPRITEFAEQLAGRYNHGWTADEDCPVR
jgi:hypothetical protein